FAVDASPAYGVLSGTAPDLTYTPNAGYVGSDSFSFTVSDGVLASEPALVSITVNASGPSQIFFDDFETDLGWVTNPYGTDTATTGMWERAIPEAVYYDGDKQLSTTVSGIYDLVTGPLYGNNAGSYDIDSGVTSILSPEITLPSGSTINLTFSSYLAYARNATSDDFLRVIILGTSNQVVFEELGRSDDQDAVWAEHEIDISAFAGQTIRLLIEAADAGSASLVEAGVDDILIKTDRPNNAPVATPQSLSLAEDSSLAVTLSGSDPDGDPLTYEVIDQPQHGSISGAMPNLTYTPDADFYGTDSFSFSINDGIVSSEPAFIDLQVTAVNDAPVAEAFDVITQVNTGVELVLLGSDLEGDALTYVIVDDPDHGTLSGTAPNLLYTPESGYIGEDAFTYKVNDGTLDSDPALVSITVTPAGPITVFFDDFETDLGWTFNPFGTDTATTGMWERANPETVDYYGYKQLGTTVSGFYDLVTGPLYGNNAGSYDIDGGRTSVRSPDITLPTGQNLTLSFSYYLAHASNAREDDYLRVTVVGSSSQMVFEELGGRSDDDAYWETFSVNLNAFAGQTVYILIEAADDGSSSLVEAGIDDVLIMAE
ncbi:MAG: Ig-like domain-containing protein, partial [Anaerolineales bacterium]